LRVAGMPGFYDKLLQVPLLNLSVTLLDRLARSPRLQRIDPAAWRLPRRSRQAAKAGRRHPAYIGVWAGALRARSAPAPRLERVARGAWRRPRRSGEAARAGRRHLAYIGVWAVAFGA